MSLVKQRILLIISIVCTTITCVVSTDAIMELADEGLSPNCLACPPCPTYTTKCAVTPEEADYATFELFCALSIFIEFHMREELTISEELEGHKEDQRYEKAALDVWLRYGEFFEEDGCLLERNRPR